MLNLATFRSPRIMVMTPLHSRTPQGVSLRAGALGALLAISGLSVLFERRGGGDGTMPATFTLPAGADLGRLLLLLAAFALYFLMMPVIGNMVASALFLFAAMWLLALNGIAYLAYGIVTGRLRERLLPIRIGDLVQTVRDTLRFRIAHEDLTVYNAVQKLLYIVVILAGIAQVVSGLAIWKPVQFQELTALLGGFQSARLIHFLGMAVIVGFLGVLIVLRPWEAGVAGQFGPALVVMVGVAAWAMAMISIRRMGQSGERNVTIVLLFSIGSTVLAALLAAPVWVAPTGPQLLALVGVGVISTGAQVLMTEGYRSGEATMLAPFEYGAIIYAVLLGWLIWAEVPDGWDFVGIGVLVLSGLYTWWREGRS